MPLPHQIYVSWMKGPKLVNDGRQRSGHPVFDKRHFSSPTLLNRLYQRGGVVRITCHKDNSRRPFLLVERGNKVLAARPSLAEVPLADLSFCDSSAGVLRRHCWEPRGTGGVLPLLPARQTRKNGCWRRSLRSFRSTPIVSAVSGSSCTGS